MEVPLTNLIHSAEKLIRDKRSSARNASTRVEQESLDKTEFSSGLTSRYLKIQETLSSLQGEFTREQMKLGILNEGNTPNSELINILFGETPLFRELAENPEIDQNALKEKIQEKKNKLTDAIRNLEVESENIFSVGMLKDQNHFSKSLETISGKNVQMKQLSEKTIERLIKE
ncbi:MULTISPECIES: LIC10415 family protein [Leptospira]|uniref:Uncharacterized protein n=4 Tax=Leptospira kirschneri TaxID=29507 RepID=A0A1T1DFQ7_9LEPT|nr:MULTISPECIES: hypothetical protein [Leptospira]EMO75863.1 hypothetical protein LEP1GSC127_4281 [Leptospira kirschneri str. 200801925]EJO70937.1 hypothetical protein LEP1GSC044_1150 [Leptospira kirschneri serovar Grippotyphosa str. RM52]EKO16804.1 hypothetical protein LEP1GSC081_2626 [Leptospira kirschneri str. H1]EKO52514.1 hypothetical protein LEP1GSC131_4420 [Leptospira kirschneri str. 200802841]EKO59275.1 hypothetical protein LEP1GSC082_4161 [Leptospira kirschneri str. H2]